MHQTYYEILEVSSNASQKVIEAAYRTLSQKYHPDKNKGDKHSEERMANINVAYSILTDPIKRKIYDEELRQYKTGGHSSLNQEQSKSSSEEGYLDLMEFTKKNITNILVAVLLLAAMIIPGYISDYQMEQKFIEMTKQDNILKNEKMWAWINTEKYLSGEGGYKNYLKALESYKEMAKKKSYDDGRAEQRLGEIYFFGLGLDKDYSKALSWYKQSHSEESNFMVATIYHEGLGVEKDLIKAYYYFNLLPNFDTQESRKYSSNPLITEEQDKYLDIEQYKKTSQYGNFGWIYKKFRLEADYKKKLLEKKLSTNQINQAQNLKIDG